MSRLNPWDGPASLEMKILLQGCAVHSHHVLKWMVQPQRVKGCFIPSSESSLSLAFFTTFLIDHHACRWGGFSNALR
jgi:hypothetical protein